MQAPAFKNRIGSASLAYLLNTAAPRTQGDDQGAFAGYLEGETLRCATAWKPADKGLLPLGFQTPCATDLNRLHGPLLSHVQADKMRIRMQVLNDQNVFAWKGVQEMTEGSFGFILDTDLNEIKQQIDEIKYRMQDRFELSDILRQNDDILGDRQA